MNNLLQNKKILIPIVISVVVIMLAIVIFIAIGVKEKKDKQKNGKPVEFPTDNQTTEAPKNEANTTNTSNTTDPEKEEIDNDKALEALDKKKRKAIIALLDGFLDKDTMEGFVNDYFDPKAYIAYKNVEGDESIFFDELSNISDNEGEELTEKIISIPEKLEELKEQYEELSKVSQSLNTTNSTEDASTDLNFDCYAENATEIEKYNEDDEEFGKTTVTVSLLGTKGDLTFIFYGDTIIYISDDEGNAFFDEIDEMFEE